MSICEDRITEDSTEFEKEFLKIYDGNLWTALDKMKDWQPPKALVVVPQRFADWIESQTDRKNESYWYIFDKFVEDSQKKPLGIDFFGVGDLSRYPQGWDKVLLSALVDGYTVEKEQLYEVIINGLYLVKLMKYDDSKSHGFIKKDKLVNWQETGYRLAAKQIKMIDERYMAFAVKVEEVEK